MAAMTELQKFLNTPLKYAAPQRRGTKQGDLFGVELECEGRKVNFDGLEVQLLDDWAPHADGSLREHHGEAVEWVFNGPADYEDSKKRIHALFDYFEKRKAKLVTSNRTSTHVHFNMSDKNVYQLVNMYILFSIFEDLLDRFCGEDRNGNLFCLSSRHATAQMRWAMDMFLNKFTIAVNDGNRYCSLNLAAINKFGTVEFRGMRGLDNRDDVLDWLSILNDFCRYACYDMRNPVEVIENISIKTPRGFLREVFSEKNYRLLTDGVVDDYINASIYEGLRLVQMMCYKIGTEFDKVKIVGPDFWATLGDGKKKPEPDIAPEDIINGGLIGGGRIPRARVMPADGGIDAFLARERERGIHRVEVAPRGVIPVDLAEWQRQVQAAEAHDQQVRNEIQHARLRAQQERQILNEQFAQRDNRNGNQDIPL